LRASLIKLLFYIQGVLCFVFTDEATAFEKSEFLGEIEFMKNVGSHKNIGTMLAFCTKGDQVFLVVEYAKYGDLLHGLSKRQTMK